MEDLERYSEDELLKGLFLRKFGNKQFNLCPYCNSTIGFVDKEDFGYYVLACQGVCGTIYVDREAPRKVLELLEIYS